MDLLEIHLAAYLRGLEKCRTNETMTCVEGRSKEFRKEKTKASDMYIFIYTYNELYLSFFLSIFLSTYLSAYLSIYPSIYSIYSNLI